MLCLMFGTLNVPPHQDTPIKLKKNGTLVGLPEKYSPASFNSSNYILEIGNKTFNIPQCVTGYITELKNPTFSFSASWYHRKPKLPDYEPLPDYLSLIVSSSAENQSDVQILFNLETLEVFEINILEENVAVDGIKYSLYYNEQEISESCKEEMTNSITKK